jgi:hypothetical protein
MVGAGNWGTAMPTGKQKVRAPWGARILVVFGVVLTMVGFGGLAVA